MSTDARCVAAIAAAAQSSDELDADVERCFRERCASNEVVLRFYNWKTDCTILVRVRVIDIPRSVRSAIHGFAPAPASASGREQYSPGALNHMRTEWVKRMHATSMWLESARLRSTDNTAWGCMTVYA